jgi:hypothetical protein
VAAMCEVSQWLLQLGRGTQKLDCLSVKKTAGTKEAAPQERGQSGAENR